MFSEKKTKKKKELETVQSITKRNGKKVDITYQEVDKLPKEVKVSRRVGVMQPD